MLFSLLALMLAFPMYISAQATEGTLTFTVKTITNNLGYSPKHVLSIWIKDGQGNFVVSCKVMANARKQHLVKWVANSANNVTNAITGATLAQHTTHTITWNGKNAAGNLVPDGTYQVWIEYTSQNSATSAPAGPFTYVEFTKSTVSKHLTPASLTYFSNMVLDWVPDNTGVGIETTERDEMGISVAPNPFASYTEIRFTLKNKSQVQANLIDLQGNLAECLLNDVLQAGSYTLPWDGSNSHGTRMKPGVYFLQLTINGIRHTRKIILSE